MARRPPLPDGCIWLDEAVELITSNIVELSPETRAILDEGHELTERLNRTLKSLGAGDSIVDTWEAKKRQLEPSPWNVPARTQALDWLLRELAYGESGLQATRRDANGKEKLLKREDFRSPKGPSYLEGKRLAFVSEAELRAALTVIDASESPEGSGRRRRALKAEVDKAKELFDAKVESNTGMAPDPGAYSRWATEIGREVNVSHDALRRKIAQWAEERRERDDEDDDDFLDDESIA